MVSSPPFGQRFNITAIELSSKIDSVTICLDHANNQRVKGHDIKLHCLSNLSLFISISPQKHH